jgi:hypothetical protein
MVHTNALTAAVAGIILSGGLGAASAAEPPIGHIEKLQGSALISQGAQYVPAHAGMDLRKLDRIIVMDDSSATLSFADGCVYEMGEQDLVTLTGESACKPDPASDLLTNATSGETGTAQTAEALEQAATGQLGAGAGAAGGLAGGNIGLAVIGVAAAGGVIYAATNDDPDRPRSRTFLSPQ